MPYISSSPWKDAAEYGAGLGNTLGSILAGMPQQRAQLAIWQAQQQLEQRSAMQKFALDQAAQAQKNQYQNSEIALHQQELKQKDELHKIELLKQQKQLEAEQRRTQLEEKGIFKPYKDPATGLLYMYNDRMGEMRPATGPQVTTPSSTGGALGAPPTGNGTGPQLGGMAPPKPETPAQAEHNIGQLAGLYGRSLGATNIPAMDPKFQGALSNLFYNAVRPKLAAPGGGMGAAAPQAPVAPPATPMPSNPANAGTRFKWDPNSGSLVPNN